MNIVLVMNEVPTVTNPMIRKSSLPDFRFSPDESSESVRISAFDELYGALDGYIGSRRVQEMYVVRHEHEGVQEI
ncbi:MAG: hypothetical protein WCB53_12950, partial [Terriglobales bacterium]